MKVIILAGGKGTRLAPYTVAFPKPLLPIGDKPILEVNGDWEITNYIEKPTMTYFNSMGIYVYEPCLIPFIEKGKYLDLPELVLKLIQSGEKVVGYYHEKPHYWLDIGRYEDYQKATEEFEKRKDEFLPKEI